MMANQKTTLRCSMWLRATAALAGLGTLFAGVGEAKPVQDESAVLGQATIWLSNNDVMLSQGGRNLGSVELSDSAASQRLRALLSQQRREKTAEKGLTVSPLIVADGGAGFAWPRHYNEALGSERAGIAGSTITGDHRGTATGEKHRGDKIDGSRVVKE